jgi:hypothetical protein
MDLTHKEEHISGHKTRNLAPDLRHPYGRYLSNARHFWVAIDLTPMASLK